MQKIHFKIDLLSTNNFPEAGVKTEGVIFVFSFFVEQSTELISDKTSCVKTHSQEKKNWQNGRIHFPVAVGATMNKQPQGQWGSYRLD